ncbi:uncharacterized protein LOC122256502 [Penaeus japonicus]|uniref:uncharacterized protein LOC122256502 n=1 Tax=Penaeus japonicus TaxID=27405 RepID=UPI001C71708F|nr:uncharacterized protein LOC122256502 [Penaeus japonicus]
MTNRVATMTISRTKNLFLLLLLWAVRASDGMADGAPPGSGLGAPLAEQDHVMSMEDVPEPAVAHHVASPGKVSATEPYIDPATPVKVKAYVGVTAILPCIVNNLGQRSTLREGNEAALSTLDHEAPCNLHHRRRNLINLAIGEAARPSICIASMILGKFKETNKR